MQKNSDNLISIITPVYNVEKYIGRCIDSVLAQDYTNWELILVDDGSQDACGNICDEYAKNDSRIVVRHTINNGRSSARNLGLALASGKYIAFIDSDDYVSPCYLSSMIDAIIQDDDIVVMPSQGYKPVNSDGTLHNNYREISFPNISICSGENNDLWGKYDLLYMQAVWGRLFIKDIIKENKISFNCKVNSCEDAMFLHEYMLFVDVFVFLSSQNYYYVAPSSQRKETPKDYDEIYQLASFYSVCSLKLIYKLALAKNSYVNKLVNLFHYRYWILCFDNNCPSKYRKLAQELDNHVLKYKQITNCRDLIQMLRYKLI